jgi:hypothetical protein
MFNSSDIILGVIDDLMQPFHGHYDQLYMYQNEYGLFVVVKSKTN